MINLPSLDTFLPGTFISSPNKGERRSSSAIDMIILHYTGMSSEECALKWLCDPFSEVSCHYFVRENGELVQIVPEQCRAWHAGQSSWQKNTDLNSCSIGIEISNPGHEGGLIPFSPPQIQTTIHLCRDLIQRYSLPPERILGHSDVAPYRKRDPGEHFPWADLKAAGIGYYPNLPFFESKIVMEKGAQGEEVHIFQAALEKYGYDIPVTGFFCERTDYVVKAFQRHFCPQTIDGKVTLHLMHTLQKLLEQCGLNRVRVF